MDEEKVPNAINMPWIGFGTSLCELDETIKGVHEALKLGYRHIDTAEYYNNEVAIGKVLKEVNIPREEIFLTTKLNPGASVLNMPEKNYDQTIESFERSRENLQVEYIDLYLIHHALAVDYRVEQYRALVDLQKKGLVKHIGVSNYGIKHLEELIANDLPLPAVNQVEIHPMCTQSKLVEFMKNNQILPVAYSSLAPLLDLRHEKSQTSAATESEKEIQRKQEENRQVWEAMAAKYNISQAQLLFKWALQHGYGILPKSTKPHRIMENFQLYHFSISDADMRRIDDMDMNLALAWSKVNLNPVDVP